MRMRIGRAVRVVREAAAAGRGEREQMGPNQVGAAVIRSDQMVALEHVHSIVVELADGHTSGVVDLSRAGKLIVPDLPLLERAFPPAKPAPLIDLNGPRLVGIQIDQPERAGEIMPLERKECRHIMASGPSLPW